MPLKTKTHTANWKTVLRSLFKKMPADQTGHVRRDLSRVP
jgi:hypothetical protein